MKWVLTTSNIIVGSTGGDAVYHSEEECPPDVRRRLRQATSRPPDFTLVNPEALEAIRSNRVARRRKPARSQAPTEKLVLPRWQVMTGIVIVTVAALVTLLSWGMNAS